MSSFRVEGWKSLSSATVYYVEADTAQQAEAMCKAGEVAYYESDIEEGDEEWIETVSVVEEESNPNFSK